MFVNVLYLENLVCIDDRKDIEVFSLLPHINISLFTASYSDNCCIGSTSN